jgi:predicted exporter
LRGRRAAILVWLGGLALCVVVVARLHVSTDMTAFLPRNASPGQRVLTEQLRDGVASRLILVAIEGVPVDRLAVLSRALADGLGHDPHFAAVQNGQDGALEPDRAFLWSNRYVLSDQVTPARFSAAGLHASLQNDLDELGSTGGMLIESMLAEDPTGEMLHLLDQLLGAGSGPARSHGVWMSPDGSRALLLTQLRAPGSDIDAAEHGIAAIRTAFAGANADGAARLIVTGPPVFAVESRARIKSDATRLSILAGLLVAAALLAAYRSPRILVLAFVPVVTGALAGVAAVGVVFSTVHGITLGFGATLIGEAVDYAVYLLTQTAADAPVEATIGRIWPTLLLGVLTSIVGFSAMLLSSFEGFAQLGLFTITGLAVAVCTTRWVLPALIPGRFQGARQSRAIMHIAASALGGRPLRPMVWVCVVVAIGVLAWTPGAFWAGDLASLSPVPPAALRLDQSLRRDLRAPDAAFLAVVRRPELESVLEASEQLSGVLDGQAKAGMLSGFDAPTRVLPSEAMQRARLAALPDTATLEADLAAALGGLSFQPDYFQPFVKAVAEARTHQPIGPSTLDGTSLMLRLEALLLHRDGGWTAMLPLRGVTGSASVAAAVGREPMAELIDLKAASNDLLRDFLREGTTLAGLGTGAIVLLLVAALRSLSRLVAVLEPLAAAVVVTLAALRLGGHSLSVFNLFGLLLVVAIGSNYCLFLDRQRNDAAGTPRVLASLMLANGCTVAGFGVLAISRTPVLHDLGLPVAMGTFLSLVFAIILMAPRRIPTSFAAES